MPIGVEAYLLSQADVDRGVTITFPMKESNISVQSQVPNSVISKLIIYASFWSHFYVSSHIIVEMYPGPVTFIFLNNSNLPSDFDGYCIYFIVFAHA